MSFIGACRCRTDKEYVNPCSADWNESMTCQVEFPSFCSDIVCDFICKDMRARRYSKTACRLTYLGKYAPQFLMRIMSLQNLNIVPLL